MTTTFLLYPLHSDYLRAKLGMGNFKSLCHEDIALQKSVNEELWRR